MTYFRFDPQYAKEFGVDEAIMIYNFQFWIKKNKQKNNQKGINFHDGRTWTYNSAAGFAEVFCFWSNRQIERILKSLVKQDVLIKGNYNKARYDKTAWYAFKDESIYIKEENHSRKRVNGFTQTSEPIPDSKTDNKPNNKTDKEPLPVSVQLKNDTPVTNVAEPIEVNELKRQAARWENRLKELTRQPVIKSNKDAESLQERIKEHGFDKMLKMLEFKVEAWKGWDAETNLTIKTLCEKEKCSRYIEESGSKKREQELSRLRREAGQMYYLETIRLMQSGDEKQLNALEKEWKADWQGTVKKIEQGVMTW